MSARRIEAVTASVLFAVAAVTLPAAATGAAHGDRGGAGTAVAGAPAETTSSAPTTTSRTTSGTPCPSVTRPSPLAPGSLARSDTFEDGSVDGWAVTGDAAVAPTADAAAARSGAYGMLLPNLSAGPATTTVSGAKARGTFRASVFVRLPQGSPQAVVQLRVLDGESGTELSSPRQKKIGDAKFVQFSREYTVGLTMRAVYCDGVLQAAWEEARPVTLELSVVGGDEGSAVAVAVDDVTVTFVRAPAGGTTNCRPRTTTTKKSHSTTRKKSRSTTRSATRS